MTEHDRMTNHAIASAIVDEITRKLAENPLTPDDGVRRLWDTSIAIAQVQATLAVNATLDRLVQLLASKP